MSQDVCLPSWMKLFYCLSNIVGFVKGLGALIAVITSCRHWMLPCRPVWYICYHLLLTCLLWPTIAGLYRQTIIHFSVYTVRHLWPDYAKVLTLDLVWLAHLDFSPSCQWSLFTTSSAYFDTWTTAVPWWHIVLYVIYVSDWYMSAGIHVTDWCMSWEKFQLLNVFSSS